MKILSIFILIGTLQVSGTVYSQQAKVTLNLSDVELIEVFNKIRMSTGYTFAYSTEEINEKEIVSVSAEDQSITEILNDIFEGKNLAFKIVDDIIVISPKPEEATQSQPNRIIKGQVLDSKTREPLPGANVLEKNGRRGTITDIDGHFSIEVPPSGVILMVTFIGFETKEIPVRQDDEYIIYLDEDINELGQVVVTGYQEIKKERMTGSVSEMTAHEIAQTGAVSIDQAIRGQMAGVSSISTTGRPGASTQIRIRGLNSITGDMNPVWIVDGVEMQGAVPSVDMGGVDLQNSLFTDGIGNIPPEDIASITVLKDASATAIYGARAANGVIVIETKKGVAGQKTISLSTQWGVEMAPRHNLQMMNSAQKVMFEQQLYYDNPNLDMAGRAYLITRNMDIGIITEEEGEAMLEELKNTNTDWTKELFNPAFYQQYALTLRGGDEKLNYYVSGNLRDTKGTLEGNDNSNLSTTAKVNYSIAENLRLETGIRANMRKDNYPTNATGLDPFKYALFANPYEKPYNEDGSYSYDRSYMNGWYQGEGNYEYDYNILEDLADGNQYTQANSATMNAKLTWDIIKTLSVESLYSYSFSNSNSEDWASPGSVRSLRNGWLNDYNTIKYGHLNNNGFLRETSGRNNEWQWRSLLNYNTSVKKWFINAMAGMEMAQSKTNSFYNMMPVFDPDYRLGGYPDLDLPLNIVDLTKLGGTAYVENRRMSYFTTASFSYNDRYIATYSLRYDGINTIAKTNQFTPLWSTSFRWNAHNEAFFNNLTWLDVFALRLSYGFTGSIDRSAQPFSTLQYNDLYGYGGVYVPTDINWRNPDVKWQKKEDINLGIDFGFLQNKVNGVFNYYRNNVRDMLSTQYLPNSSGVTSIKANTATLRNQGIELNLNTRVMSRSDFSLTLNFNIAHNLNKIIKSEFKELTDLAIAGKNRTTQYVEGYEVGSQFAYAFAGVDPITGNTLAYVQNMEYVKPWEIHSEIDGRPVIDMDSNFNHKASISYVGAGYPPVNGGFGFNARYKGLTLTSQFTYSAGHMVRSINNNGYNLDRFNRNTIVSDFYHWRQPGDITQYPQHRNGAYRNSYGVYLFDNEYEKGDFLKLASMSLVYNLPHSLIKELNLNRVKVGLTAQNLATWTKYKGLDPEGLGAITYPNPVRLIGSLSIEF
ncbi:MAG: SusC/RagA family TonB-linked outer membrane protein [Bacteroidales bacterium]|nr:SusC/RagA family TonB-linked outer membrane protein [Bacteroidales bacterium]